MKKLKLLKILSLLLYIFYVFSVIFMICIKKYNYSAICAGCIVINFILNLLNKKFTYLFNDALVILLELFVLFSLVLGTSYGGYKINHYDDVLHICSGVIGSVIAYIIINLYTNKEIRENIKTVFFGIFIFMFSVAIGNLWEVLEFLLDVMFKINCQAGGLNDTMVDMIDGIIGAIIYLPFLLRKL